MLPTAWRTGSISRSSAIPRRLGARIDTFPKGSRLLRAGDAVEELGLVLAGSALIVQEDIWGNRNILSKAGPGQTFAEVFACAPGAVLNVSVEAESAVTVMFLRVRRVLSVCPSACSHHSRICLLYTSNAISFAFFVGFFCVGPLRPAAAAAVGPPVLRRYGSFPQ